MTASDVEDDPDAMLWVALVLAPEKGTTVLRDLAEQGHMIQVSRGRWRAVTDDTA